MSTKKVDLQLVFPENLKKDANLSPTEHLSFDDLGDFVEERTKISRALERASETKLRIDYSDFSNHVFFDSAQVKFDIAYNKILSDYPYNGTLEEKDAYHLTGSAYERHVFDQWPRHVGYVHLSGTQFISASDTDNKLYLGSSSLYVSVWHKPDIVTTIHPIVQVFSASSGTSRVGYELFLSNSLGDVHAKFSMYSGSSITSVSASVASVTSSFSNLGVIYDQAAQLLSIYVNSNKIQSASIAFGSLEFAPTKVYIGSGSRNTNQTRFELYSGSLDEIRIFHTASELFHVKNYNRPIDAYSHLRLHYKFNEGVTDIASVDKIAVDYSKSGLHGIINNYASDVRISGSTMTADYGDPILYSFHSSVVSFSSSIAASASLYDKNNNNLIFNLIPEGVRLEDEGASGLLNSFALGMARYFDNIKLYIDQFDNLRVTNYQEVDESPDLFLPYLQRYFGWKITEHFGNANPLEFFFGENILSSTGSLDVSLFEIRNQFWRRILNNLPYLLKTKGKRHNLDAFFNVLGIGTNNFSLKEYGYLPGGTIQNSYIHQNKPVAFLGIGTGSLSSSYVKVPNLVSSSLTSYTVETLVQLPHASASYDATVLTGSLWQFVDRTQVTGSFALLWNVPTLGSSEGKFILTSSDGQRFSSSLVSVFDGDFVNIAAGLGPTSIPFIEIRTLDNDEIDYSASFTGAVAFSGVFTGSNFDFIIGANSGSIFTHKAHGYFGENRFWRRKLSGSELDAHALNFESVGIGDPLEYPHPLLGHWPLNENMSVNSAGALYVAQDLSRNGRLGTGSLFAASENPYQKFLYEYNHLSPSIDLKWTENKVRIRNKSELTLSDVAQDTNEVSLEFNLVDTLNRDISKIFSTFDLINNAVGNPVNKYREDYAELESYRRVYFDRLGDSLHFTNFFKLFRWFDKKISDSIKQLLPARVRFIGGEQVVESHFLERPRYAYKYPIFRTPVDLPSIELSGVISASGDVMPIMPEGVVLGTYPRTVLDAKGKYTNIDPPQRIVDVQGTPPVEMVTTYNDGVEKPDKINGVPGLFRVKLSGDERDSSNNPNSGVNWRNEHTRRTLQYLERDNKDGYRSGSFVHAKLGNAFLSKTADSSRDQEYYFGGASKVVHFYLGTNNSGTRETAVSSSLTKYDATQNITYITSSVNDPGVSAITFFSTSLYDQNNVHITSSQRYPNMMSYYVNSDSEVQRDVYEVSFELSRSSETGNVSAELFISYGVDNSYSTFLNTTVPFTTEGYLYSCFKTSLDNGWTRFLFNIKEKRNSFPVDETLSFHAKTSSNKRCLFVISFYHNGTLSSGNNVIALRNMKYKFRESLTSEGVEFYRNINNQNNDDIIEFLKYNVIKKVE